MKKRVKLPIEYLVSAVLPRDYPQGDLPEIAVTGRSNAGKSSFLNALAGRSIAKVSQEPGKTRLLNFFDVGQRYRIVDMPGYGFSKRTLEEKRSWQGMIEDYLSHRSNLAGILLIMDCRRSWSDDEELLAEFAERVQRPILVILTKSDQLNQSEAFHAVQKIQGASGILDVYLCSSETKKGIEQVEDAYYRLMLSGQAPKEGE